MAKYGKGIKKYIVSKINKKTFEMFYTFFSFQKGTSFFGILWKSVMVNFGGQPSPTIIDNFNSYKSVIITSLFGGLVIWASYNAQLTSRLSVDMKKYPFNDLDTLSQTNYL